MKRREGAVRVARSHRRRHDTREVPSSCRGAHAIHRICDRTKAQARPARRCALGHTAAAPISKRTSHGAKVPARSDLGTGS
jgi:hypothetical protein